MNISRIQVFLFYQAEKTQECLEDKMQIANKAWWRDVKIYRSKDVPWRVKSRRMVEYVHNVFCFGSGSWSRSQAILDRIEGWKTEAMRRLFRFKKGGR